MLRAFLSILFLGIGAGLFAFLEMATAVKTGFILNYLVLGCIFYYHLYLEKRFSPFLSSYIVFTLLFFIVAPIIQIHSFTSFTKEYKTQLPFDELGAIFTNILILIFQVTFFAGYLLFVRLKKPKPPSYTGRNESLLSAQVMILAIVCLILFATNFHFVVEELERPSWMPFDESIFSLLIRKKVLFMIPLAGVVMCCHYLRKAKQAVWANLTVVIGCLLLFLVLLFWFKNPLTEKRNALGPIFFCLIFLFVPRLVNTNVKTTAMLFLSLIVAFPLVSILTHSQVSLDKMLDRPSVLFKNIKGDGLIATFNTLNYDAFSNISATVEYTEAEGFTWGHQQLSTFFFFIPRSVWPSKALPTGQLVGNYLIDEHGFNYNNLSNPLVSEGYVDFGIPGVIIMALLLAFVVRFFMSWIISDDYLRRNAAFYFSIHLMFLLRGDLTSGYVYMVGTLFGILFLPKLINQAIPILFFKKIQRS